MMHVNRVSSEYYIAGGNPDTITYSKLKTTEIRSFS